MGFIEFAFVLHLNQRNEKNLKSDQSSDSHCKDNDKDKRVSEPLTVNNIKCTIDDKTVLVKPKHDVKKIDLIAFKVGTLLYVLFNVIYWIIFANIKLD